MWALAEEVADLMLGSAPPTDPTAGALWFHETFRSQPRWMRNQVRRTATLGSHHFYARN
jgi:spore germination cell wall hydrolase CwlJ-like protein